MELTKVANPLDEALYRGRHESGLSVLALEKPWTKRTFAVFATNFGSVDNTLVDDVTGQTETVPDGVAHFLEHKMFEDEDGDVSERFAALGAYSNAATGFTGTTYVFSTTSREEECLALLLDFVLKPWFTPELVAKEQGIIGEEIRMYRDDAGWRVFFNLLQSLYSRHPVHIDIAGTEESIAKIDPRVLYACHRQFYRPGNMNLAVVGGLSAQIVAGHVDRALAGRDVARGGRIHRSRIEDRAVRARTRRDTMDIARSRLLVGWKDDPTTVSATGGRVVERRELETALLLDLAFGRSSAAHDRLYREGLIDDSFGVEYTGEDDFGFAIVGGETDDPERLERRVREEIAALLARRVEPADFERARNKFLGRFVAQFDSPESTAYGLSSADFRGLDPFDSFAVIREIGPADLDRRAREIFVEERSASSIVVPSAK